MCIVPVRICHQSNTSTEIKIYALLDENCQGTFIKESIIKQLPVKTRAACITTETINGQSTDSALAVDGLVVKPLKEFENQYGVAKISLPTTYSRDSLYCHEEEIPTANKIKHYNYLQPILEKLPDYDPSLVLGIIIGANCPKALEPQEIIPSTSSGPYASRSLLGWRVIGPMKPTAEPESTTKCYRIGFKIPSIDIATNEPSPHHFTSSTTIRDEYISKSLKEMYLLDFNEENSEERALSNEDKEFLNIMQNGVTLVDNHYQLPLPFRNPKLTMSNNREQALQRLSSIKKKMQRDSEYRKDYCEFMATILTKNYAVKSNSSLEGKSWYLPHFGVRQESKKKLRIVFDCSVKYKDSCLNEELLPGPDLTNLLVGVLLRFRHGKNRIHGRYRIHVLSSSCAL